MPKSAVREIAVHKAFTVIFLIAATIGIATLTLWVSGKSYNKVNPEPFREVKMIAERLSEGSISVPVLVALLMPILMNVLLFVPWGFLMFLALDSPKRPASQSYLLTLILGFAFSSIVESAQYFLPTRVMDVNDVIWNASGALLGAVLGHLRKRVRIVFE